MGKHELFSSWETWILPSWKKIISSPELFRVTNMSMNQETYLNKWLNTHTPNFQVRMSDFSLNMQIKITRTLCYDFPWNRFKYRGTCAM